VQQRVVITGIGVVSPYGEGRELYWGSLKQAFGSKNAALAVGRVDGGRAA
jgi:3-oxoacyl-(acyl-carrier-protein) synthase